MTTTELGLHCAFILFLNVALCKSLKHALMRKHRQIKNKHTVYGTSLWNCASVLCWAKLKGFFLLDSFYFKRVFKRCKLNTINNTRSCFLHNAQVYSKFLPAQCLWPLAQDVCIYTHRARTRAHTHSLRAWITHTNTFIIALSIILLSFVQGITTSKQFPLSASTRHSQTKTIQA